MLGGGGFKLKYAAPIPGIDDVAADFPSLTIIMSHPAWPWIDQQIAVALHTPNVFLDLSGWSPRFIPQALIRETNTRLKDKVFCLGLISHTYHLTDGCGSLMHWKFVME